MRVPFQKVGYSKDAHDLDADEARGITYEDKLSNLVQDDKSLLKRLLSMLAFGVSLPADMKDSSNAQIFLAAENLRLAKEGRGSMFRRIVTNAFTTLVPRYYWRKDGPNPSRTPIGSLFANRLFQRAKLAHL